MRDIKFRGKRVDNGEWVYGDLLQSGEHRFIMPEVAGWHEFYDATVKLDPSTVGQYTGLKDKNGKGIYDGDVLKVSKSHQPFGSDVTKTVGYADSTARFHLMGTSYDNLWEAITNIIGKNCATVIGNIHDNPELLKLEE
jgi:uncharacterized phage protein (TIGR01671 family)